MKSITIKYSTLLILIAFATILTSCGQAGNGGQVIPPIDAISAAEWNTISHKRIFFGHQSVGNNILSGVKSLADGAGVRLQIVESRTTPSQNGITHFKIGKNEDPISKISDFENALKSGAAHGSDVAMMKLCYIDINSGSDAKKIATEYITSLERLSVQFPNTIFIAVTVPLRTVQSGVKAWLKLKLGREPGGYSENRSRQEFNTLLRNTFGQQNRLLDLAKFESYGAGRHQFQGLPLEVLNPALSDDGGHLNTQGQLYIATKLLKFIASIPSQQ